MQCLFPQPNVTWWNGINFFLISLIISLLLLEPPEHEENFEVENEHDEECCPHNSHYRRHEVLRLEVGGAACGEIFLFCT